VLVNRALLRVGHASPEQTPLSFSFNLPKLDILQYNKLLYSARYTDKLDFIGYDAAEVVATNRTSGSAQSYCDTLRKHKTVATLVHIPLYQLNTPLYRQRVTWPTTETPRTTRLLRPALRRRPTTTATRSKMALRRAPKTEHALSAAKHLPLPRLDDTSIYTSSRRTQSLPTVCTMSTRSGSFVVVSPADSRGTA
jgi:hypothetical protein